MEFSGAFILRGDREPLFVGDGIMVRDLAALLGVSATLILTRLALTWPLGSTPPHINARLTGDAVCRVLDVLDVEHLSV